MRWIILLSLFGILASDASAQHRGGVARGFRYNRGAAVLPYGFGYGDDAFLPYDVAPPYGYAPQPIVIVQQPPPPAMVQQPPREVHPVIVDYIQPASGPSAPPSGEPQNFGIVLKDGSTRSAIAVVVVASDDSLHYVDPEERHMRISMNEVDRVATRKLNRERNLTLWLPAAPESPAAPAPNR